MNKVTVIILSVVILFCVAAGAVLFYMVNSPEYALSRIVKDVQDGGITALEEHMTKDAIDTVDKITVWTENSLVSGIISIFSQNDTVNETISLLKEKLSDINWTVEDVLKGKQRADVVLGFNYEDQVIGTIEITMIREEGQWKISGLRTPSIEKFELNG